MCRICVNEFLESNLLNVHDRYLQFNDNRVATRCCNKKLKLPFRKSKLGMQSLSYVGPSTWNKLANSLKIVTSVNCFKACVHYFLSKFYFSIK